MSIVNRRNAVMGWLTWHALKHVGKSKAKSAVPSVHERRANRPAKAVAGAAAVGGGILVLRRVLRRRPREDGGGGEGGGDGDGDLAA